MRNWHIIATVTLAFVLHGCIADSFVEPDNNNSPSASEVQITVTIPGATVPTTRSIAGDGGESVVKTIDVLVFEKNPTNGSPDLLAERVSGTIISQSTSENENYRVKFVAKLSATNTVSSIAVVTNASTRVDNAISAAPINSPKQDVLAALTFAANSWLANDDPDYLPIPMYGEVAVAAITKGIQIDGIELERMLARIDVVNSASNFNLKNIYLSSRRTGGYIAPAWNTADGKLLPNLPAEPMIPASANIATTWLSYAYQDNSGQGLEGEIYTFEAQKTTGVEATPGHTNAFCLILEGNFTNDVSTTYYYRVDFTDPTDENGKQPDDPAYQAPAPEDVKYISLYRNNLYRVNITQVDGVGYTNPADAIRSLGVLSNLKTTLHVIDQNSINNIVFNGQHWLGVDTTTVSFPSTGGADTLKVSTNYSEGWVVDHIEYVAGVNWLTAEKILGTAQVAELGIGIITAYASTDREAYVHLKSGRLTHKIKVLQVVPTFTVSRTSASYTYTGGSFSVNVTSQTKGTAVNGGSVPASNVPWIAEYSSDGTTWTTDKPDWINFPASGAGGSNSTQSLQALTFNPVAYNPDNDALKDPANLSKGSPGIPYDLSTVKGVRNTANCYIVNSPGYYSLPLVYGNAISESKTGAGIANTSAYTSTKVSGGSVKVLTNFLRHDGNAIQYPEIWNNTFAVDTVTPGKELIADATLVWMDADGLVNNVQLDASKQNIQFEVQRNTIKQGNAVIAVRNGNGVIMWSWHIWVTPLVDPVSPDVDAVINYSSITYELMRYNLGWASGSLNKYGEGPNNDQPRSMQIRITQTGVTYPKSAIITINQTPGSVQDMGTNPYFIFGRKDPVPPSSPSGTQRALFTTNPSYTYTTSPDPTTIEGAIRNPFVYYGTSTSPYIYFWTAPGTGTATSAQTPFNLWSVENTLEGVKTDNEIIKSVYDPTPAGWTVSNNNAFSGFATVAGGNTPSTPENQATFNANKGYRFYLDPNNPDANAITSIFPATGSYFGGAISNFGTSGYFTTAIPEASTTSGIYYFTFSSTRVSTSSTNSNTSGRSLRPVTE